MKKSQLKTLVKTIIKEMSENRLSTNESQDDLDKILKKAGVNANIFSDPHHNRLPGWKEQEPTIRKKKPIRPITPPQKPPFNITSLEEDHGLGYSHNGQISAPTKMQRDPLNDPMLKEDSDSYTRLQRIQSFPERMNSADLQNALKLLYEWTKTGTIDFREFVKLHREIHNKATIINLK